MGLCKAMFVLRSSEAFASDQGKKDCKTHGSRRKNPQRAPY